MEKEVKNADKFSELYSLNVNDKVEQKNGLNYLSWAWAWAEFRKAYPDADYTIKRDPTTNMPYFESKYGIMVFTSVTAGGKTHEMWLPVMDGANKAMKAEAWTYKTKYGEKTVEPADMFDINKTIMRCLVKNLAMFGLGLYIYAGEDIPEENREHWLKTWMDAINAIQSVEAMTTFYNQNQQTINANPELFEACKNKKAELTAK